MAAIRRWWRDARSWLVLGGATAAGLAGGVVAGVWLPGPWAAGVGGLIAAATGSLAGSAKQAIKRRQELRQVIKTNVLAPTARGRLGRVENMDNPVVLGVHPAESIPNGNRSRVPPYISRDNDAELRSAIQQSSFVLIVGESTAGKSRMAYEAMRAMLPEHRFAAPVSKDALQSVITEVFESGRCVLWLDDLERFLDGGLALNDVVRILENSDLHNVILATMRTSEFDRYSLRAEAAVNESDHAQWRSSRQVLGLAQVVRLERRWSANEIERAQASDRKDPRVTKALQLAEKYGIAETIAAGPQLANDWRHAWSPGAHPRAAALVAAAIDCRRAGLHEPVARATLERLHHGYLERKGGAILRPESLEDAWAWACQPSSATSSLLERSEAENCEEGYLAFDYLIDLPDNPQMTVAIWDSLFSEFSAEQAEQIGWNAYVSSRASFYKAVEVGKLNSIYNRATALSDRGYPDRAVALLRAELATGAQRDSLFLRHQVAFFTMQTGNVAGARSMFLALLPEIESENGPTDELVRTARHNIASCTRRLGDLDGALDQFRKILRDRETYLGRDALNTLATRGAIIGILIELQDLANSEILLAELITDETRVLGAAHSNTLASQSTLARVKARRGDHDGAVTLLEEMRPVMERVFGREHKEVLDLRWQIAECTAQGGNNSAALILYTEIQIDRARTLGFDHPDYVAGCETLRTLQLNGK